MGYNGGTCRVQRKEATRASTSILLLDVHCMTSVRGFAAVCIRRRHSLAGYQACQIQTYSSRCLLCTPNNRLHQSIRRRFQFQSKQRGLRQRTIAIERTLEFIHRKLRQRR